MKTTDLKLRDEKKAFRARTATEIRKRGNARIAEESAAIADLLRGLSEWSHASSIFTFLSMEHEIDTFLVIAQAIFEGKLIAVPRMYDEAELRFHTIDSMDAEWHHHPYGVREPHPSFPLADPLDPEIQPILVVTPGSAFDRRGHRLGYGRGYFDHFFTAAAAPLYAQAHELARSYPESIGQTTGGRIISVGICATCQVFDHVPIGAHDVPMDIVVSGGGIEYYRGCLEY